MMVFDIRMVVKHHLMVVYVFIKRIKWKGFFYNTGLQKMSLADLKS